MSSTILDRIVEGVRKRLAADPAPGDLEERALQAVAERRRTGGRSLRAALAVDGPAVIAECKRASPSAGVLCGDFDATVLAVAYARAGAAAISVVTERDHFLGDPRWIGSIRRLVALPVLRKDFIFCRRQLLETVLLGADAVLLISRILDDRSLADLLAAADELDLEVLLEVFADEDPKRAVASGADVIGVNARDLASFEVDLERAAFLAAAIPSDRIRVAESGVRGRPDVELLSRAGYDAFLVGEHLVRAADPGLALAELLGR
ncbi:MAG: indole-3-glycerol phosphate synthase TrpC [Acidobacteria bacterium]|nr:indole-3-glycerol phosphate synthase TrpC [Acidobacteriota bacterium]